MSRMSPDDRKILAAISERFPPMPRAIVPQKGRVSQITQEIKDRFFSVVTGRFQDRLAFAEALRTWAREWPDEAAQADPYWLSWASRLPSQEDATTRHIYKERLSAFFDLYLSVYGPRIPVSLDFDREARDRAASSLGLSVEEVSWLFPLPQIAVDPTKKEGEKIFSPSQNFSLAKGGEPG